MRTSPSTTTCASCAPGASPRPPDDHHGPPPNRETVHTRRETAATTLHALELSNGNTLAAHLRRGASAIIDQGPKWADDLANELYLHAAQRYPTPGELDAAVALIGEPVTQPGLEDFLWSLAMLPEVQYIF